jgi:hypothetical protein
MGRSFYLNIDPPQSYSSPSRHRTHASVDACHKKNYLEPTLQKLKFLPCTVDSFTSLRGYFADTFVYDKAGLPPNSPLDPPQPPASQDSKQCQHVDPFHQLLQQTTFSPNNMSVCHPLARSTTIRQATLPIQICLPISGNQHVNTHSKHL